MFLFLSQFNILESVSTQYMLLYIFLGVLEKYEIQLK